MKLHFRASLLEPCLLASFALYLVACSAASPPERIILIVVDTLRADVLRPYGGSATAPAIESLAERGQVVENAIASFHQTPMSMTAMFTGLTPSIETGDPATPLAMTQRTSCGLARFARATTRPGCIPDSVDTLAEVLKRAGYWTMGVVSNGLLFAPFGLQQGFDDWVEVGIAFVSPEEASPVKHRQLRRSRSGQAVNAAAMDVLRRRSAERFFLYLHYMDVHDYVETLDWEREYRATVPKVDRAIGEILGALEAQDLLEGSVVILTSDHGERLFEQHLVPGMISHGGNPSFEEVLRIPLIIAPPRLEEPESLVRTQDLFSLIARIAGVEPDRRSELDPEELYLSESKWQTYRRGRWKSFKRRADGAFYLIDLTSDPGESDNAAQQHPEVAQEHMEKIASLARELAATEAAATELSPEYQGRLRALGYIE